MSCLSNILFIILVVILLHEIFANKKLINKKQKKENLIPQRNPWPKGCSKSQRNIAIKQAEKIDNLESRILTFVADIKESNKHLDEFEKRNKKIDKGVKSEISDTKKDAEAAEKAATSVKM